MNTTDLMYLEASGNYTIFHLEDSAKMIHSYTLKHFEKILKPDQAFSRIHRRYLVNRKSVVSYGQNEVILHNGKKLPIARRRAFYPLTEK